MNGRKTKPILVFLHIALVATGLSAQAEQEIDLALSGYLKAGANWSWASPEHFPFAGFTGYLRAELGLGDAGMMASSLEARADGGGLLGGTDDASGFTAELFYPLAIRIGSGGQTQTDIDLKELFWEISLGDLDVRAGKQVFSWGQADGQNPTDILNARHFTRTGATPEESKMGALAADFVYWLPDGKSRLEAVILPFGIPNDLPEIPTVFSGAGIIGDPAITVAFDSSGKPGFAADNLEGALRAQFALENLTVTASAFCLLDRFPDLSVTTVTLPAFGPPTSITVTNTFVYNRIIAGGLDWSTNIEGFDFRGEGMLSFTKDSGGTDLYTKNHSLQAVLQGSRAFLDGTLTATLSWAPRYVFQFRSEEDYGPTSAETVRQVYARNGQGFEFENGLGARAEIKLFQETLAIAGFGLYNFAARDCLATASAAWSIGDGWNVKASLTLYGSLRDSADPLRAYGTFGNDDVIDKDNVALELSWSF